MSRESSIVSREQRLRLKRFHPFATFTASVRHAEYAVCAEYTVYAEFMHLSCTIHG